MDEGIQGLRGLEMFFCEIDKIDIIERGGIIKRFLVYNSDGEQVAEFNGDWTTDKIRQALKVANIAYKLGYNNGGMDKSTEIQEVLKNYC